MNRSREKGSVLVYILIAVALLGALSFAVSKGQRGSASTLTIQQAKLAANEIIDYGNAVAKAVQKLKLRGCTDTQISFENPISAANYTNPSAPTDKHCDVFNLAGGGLNFTTLDKNVAGENAGSPYVDFSFVAANEIEKVGTDCGTAICSELLIYALVKENICQQINILLGISGISGAIPVDSDMGGTVFTGPFSYVATIGDEGTSSVLAGKTAGCFYEADVTPNYTFYQVLIAR